MHNSIYNAVVLGCLGIGATGMQPWTWAVAAEAPAVEAVEFQSREIYRSSEKPAYSAWVSLFPGSQGEWYISCEERHVTDPPQPRLPLEQWYRMVMPDGYDNLTNRSRRKRSKDHQ